MHSPSTQKQAPQDLTPPLKFVLIVLRLPRRQYHQNILDCLMGKRAEELILYVGEGPEPGNVFTDGLVTDGGLAAVIDGDVIPRVAVF